MQVTLSSVSFPWCGAEKVLSLCSAGDTGTRFLVWFMPCHRIWHIGSQSSADNLEVTEHNLGRKTIRSVRQGYGWHKAERALPAPCPLAVQAAGVRGFRAQGCLLSLTGFFCVAVFCRHGWLCSTDMSVNKRVMCLPEKQGRCMESKAPP